MNMEVKHRIILFEKKKNCNDMLVSLSEVGAIIYGCVVRSVANLTRDDARDFLAVAAELQLKIHVRSYPLGDANRALSDLRDGRIEGAAVLVP